MKEANVYERVCIQSVHWFGACQSSEALNISLWMLEAGILLVPKLTSKGTKAPHSFTFHADCNSTIQNMAMRSKVMRVKRGRRKTYFWTLAGLNWGKVGAMKGDCIGDPSPQIVEVEWM